MHDTADRALVEISLALAMAFFALMVLALVGMGMPSSPEPVEAPAATLTVRDAVPEPAPEAGEDDRGDPEVLLVVHWRGQWYDAGLAPVQPRRLEHRGQRLVVAVAPDVTVADAQAIQRALPHREPTLTTLSPAWIERLEALP
jgi:hypothetical protein